VPALGLLGGDLCRTLGGPGDVERLRSADATTFPVDLGCVLIDGRRHFFVAHLAAHRRGWAGRFAVAMNAEWMGELDLGPRAHPGDGLLDVTEGQLGLRERLVARRRARTGTHLPHPDLRVTRSGKVELSFPDGVPVFLDGVPVGEGRELLVHVEPDALTVVV
jgi:diacylglycerol kinase family enzyme